MCYKYRINWTATQLGERRVVDSISFRKLPYLLASSQQMRVSVNMIRDTRTRGMSEELCWKFL